MTKKLRAVSLFSSAGIAEFGFKDTSVELVLANELIKKRLDVHEFWHPNIKTICGDITDESVKKEIISKSKDEMVDFIFATPPCQGMSLIGKNKSNDQMILDERNYLIFHVFDIIDSINPKCILIENVSRFFKIKFKINNDLFTIKEIIQKKYGEKYNLDFEVFNTKNHGIPQHRERAIIRMWNNNYSWKNPENEDIITLSEAIGHLPPLESGEQSHIKNHYARTHIERQITWLKNTPTGKSAFENEIFFPKDEKTGRKLRGYSATYKRMCWNKPAPTVTMRNDCISSQSNVHPGRLKSDGTYSDARVLTLRELFIVNSINPDLDIPSFLTDIQIRHLIGESVPPKLINKLLRCLSEVNND